MPDNLSIGALEVLMDAISGKQEGAIERQEARGQTWFQKAGVLPRQLLHVPQAPKCVACNGYLGHSGPDRKFIRCEACNGQGTDQGTFNFLEEQLGIKFGESYDDIFIKAELPIGWTLKAQGHSMWTDILDANGSIRGAIFYKAAFYDRNAHMSLTPRYTYHMESRGDYMGGGPYEVLVTTIDHKTGEHIYTPGEWLEGGAHFELKNEHTNMGRAWLDANYPDHRNPFAYWED